MEEYQRPTFVQGMVVPGMDLESAIDRLSDWAAGVAKTAEQREEELMEERARQNREALAQIEGMIGVGGRGLA